MISAWRVGIVCAVLALAGSLHLQARAAKAQGSAPLPQAVQRPGGPSSPTAVPSAPDRALLQKYCVTCHNQRLKTAGLTLDGMDFARLGEDAEAWEKVVRRLRSGSMPPAGAPR